MPCAETRFSPNFKGFEPREQIERNPFGQNLAIKTKGTRSAPKIASSAKDRPRSPAIADASPAWPAWLGSDTRLLAKPLVQPARTRRENKATVASR